MPDLRPFQVILIGIFIALAVGGLIAFSVFRGFSADANPYGARVVLWGTLEGRAFSATIRELAEADEQFGVVSYVQKDPRTFSAELANAIAEGRGPDAIVLPNDLLISERAKLYAIPYDNFSQRTIRDTYVDGAEIFSRAAGTYGFPVAVDPLVLYWNRDLLASAGLATPPATWEALVASYVPALATIEQVPAFTVSRAALAFGTYANVTHAREILLALMLQAGSTLVTERTGGYAAALNQSAGAVARPPADAALDFYTQFSNPARTTYTWNRSLPNDRSAFLAGDLAFYVAPGSAYEGLRAGNPNLSFDVAELPQGSGTATRRSFGTFYALAPLASSQNFAGTYRALAALAAPAPAASLAERLAMAPVHRATLAVGSTNPFLQRMYTAALTARGFLDPDPAQSGGIIQTMIEDVTSNRARIDQAVSDATVRLNQLLR